MGRNKMADMVMKHNVLVFQVGILSVSKMPKNNRTLPTFPMKRDRLQSWSQVCTLQ
jgi:hypothetical protein